MLLRSLTLLLVNVPGLQSELQSDLQVGYGVELQVELAALSRSAGVAELKCPEKITGIVNFELAPITLHKDLLPMMFHSTHCFSSTIQKTSR